jgi:hypothetical protein
MSATDARAAINMLAIALLAGSPANGEPQESA